MADPRIISRILQLGKELGANISNSMGTRTNVSFLGSGPKDGMLFQKPINPESFATIGVEKVLPDIESSIAYASGNKLNGLQLDQLERNLLTMKETLNPTNVTELGIDSLRAKSGIGERQVTKIAGEGDEAAADIASINKATDELNAADTSPLMSKIENRIGGMRDETEAATGIMASVAKGDLPAKTGAAREFLINTLKVGDDYPSTTLTDVISAEDMKYIFEGGGGAMGDPLVLVQKYFGPRIAEMVPKGGSPEEIAIFTKRVMDNVEDAKGFKPDEPEFDAMTATFVDQLADGGIAGLDTRQGLRFGGKAGKAILSKIDDKMIKKAADDIFPTDDYKYDAEMVVEALVENNPKLFKNLLADDLDDALRSELYGLAVSETGTRASLKMMARRDAVKRGVVNENVPEFKRESMKLVDGVTGKGEKFKTFETTTPPRQFRLNVEKAVSDFNIPRAEAIRIASLPSDQQKLALQKYLDRDFSQRITLGDYNPKTFDAAKGGLAKILEL